MREYLEKFQDILGLWWRIKLLDPNYELLLNKKNGRLEIHNEKQAGSSFVCVASPCDARLIKRLWETRRENAKKFFEMLEKHNIEQKMRTEKSIVENSQSRLEEVVKYSFITNRELSEAEIKKIINN